MKQRLARLRELSPREVRFLVWVTFWFVIVRIGLAATSYRGVQQALGKIADGGRRSRKLTAERVVRLVQIASNRRPIAATCVPRALTAWLLLSRLGYDVEVQLGANKDVGVGEELAAHAWVEVDGKPVGEDADLYEKFVVFR